MSLKRTAFGYVALALGLTVAGAGVHANSEPPSARSHSAGDALLGALGTAGSLGAGAGICYVGYRLLTSSGSRRSVTLDETNATRRRTDDEPAA
jgi:hypothetical protein